MIKNAFGFYIALYKHPRALYTKSTPSFIYFVVRGKLEEKETINMTTTTISKKQAHAIWMATSRISTSTRTSTWMKGGR